MKNNQYPIILPYISPNTKFIATMLAFLLGAALMGGLSGDPEPSAMATEEIRTPEATENAG